MKEIDELLKPIPVKRDGSTYMIEYYDRKHLNELLRCCVTILKMDYEVSLTNHTTPTIIIKGNGSKGLLGYTKIIFKIKYGGFFSKPIK